MSGERQLAPWLNSGTVETVGRVVPAGRAEPARRVRLSFEDRRQQLLQACLVAFTSRGLELTTMDTIAAQAGVSKPLVYRHFPNRFEALLAVVDQQSEELLAVLDLEASPPLSDLILAYLTFASGSPAGFRLLFQMVDGSPGPARRRLQAVRAQLEDAVLSATLRDAGADAVTANAARSAGLGPLLVSILEGVAGALREGDDPAPRARAVRQLLDPRWVLASLLSGPELRPDARAVAPPLHA